MKPIFLLVSFFAALGAQAQWTQRVSGTSSELYAVQFADGNTGFAVGANGTVLRSVDAGLSWSLLPFPNSGELRSVYFHDPLNGFVVGDSGLYRTTDGGAAWSNVATPAAGPWRSITFVTPTLGFCGGGFFGNGNLLRTTDGGATWTAQVIGGDNPISRVFFPTAEVGYAVFYGYNWSVLKTTDGGETWSAVPIQPISNLSNLEGLYFLDADTGYAGGWYIAAFIRTTDGGATWSEVSPQFDMNSIALASATHGVAVGWNGRIHHMTNGTDWTDESWTDNSASFYSVDLASDSVAVAVGSAGLVLRWAAVPTGVRPATDLPLAITLRPNPATELIELHCAAPLPNNTRLELVDARGTVVLQALVRGQSPISVAGVRPGLYTWRCLSPAGPLAQGTLVIK